MQIILHDDQVATFIFALQHKFRSARPGQAIKELKQEGNLDSHVTHLQIKYRNNRLEADHGKLKRLIHPVRGFQSMKTAYATIRGFEVMRMFKKGQFNIWMYGNRTEVSFINEQFGIYS